MNSNLNNEIKIIDIINRIYCHRKFLIKISVVGFVIGVLISFSMPKEYRTIVKITPEQSLSNSNMQQIGSLASVVGLNIGNNGEDGLSPVLFPEIIKSTPFLISFKSIKLNGSNDDQNITLGEYLNDVVKKPLWAYVFGFPSAAITEVSKFLFDNDECVQNQIGKLIILEPEDYDFLNSFASRISLHVDTKTGLITFETIMQDPLISAQVADTVVNKLQDYIINYKTGKSKKDLDYALRLFFDAKKRYEDAQIKYANYLDANKNIASASYAIEKSNLENEVSLTFGIYSNLAQQVEMSKAKVQQDTPVITILEPAKIPNKPDGPRRIIIILFFVVLSIIFGIASLFFYDFISKLQKNK